MSNFLSNFLYMDGYGYYIWPAYGFVLGFLFLQWIIPWYRLHTHHQKKEKNLKNNYHIKHHHESHP